LRLLNGSHSLLAYTGYLAGFEHISSAMAEPAFANMVRRHMAREAGETIVAPAGFDLVAYQQKLCERFANPALKHRTAQVATDGSQKVPQRLLQPLRQQLAGAGHIDTICLALATWIRFLSGTDEQGKPIEASDPLAGVLCERANAFPDDSLATVRSVVALSEVFDSDLKDESAFIECTALWLSRLRERGALATVREYFG
jgi:fructuronate reductase